MRYEMYTWRPKLLFGKIFPSKNQAIAATVD